MNNHVVMPKTAHNEHAVLPELSQIIFSQQTDNLSTHFLPLFQRIRPVIIGISANPTNYPQLISCL